MTMELDVVSPTEMSDSFVSVDIDSAAMPSTSGSGFDLGAVSAAGGGGGGGFGDMVTQLRRNGLDIVIVFDSTGSMGGEINQVKSQIKRIGNALMNLIPKTRISVCTYRDTTDFYTVKGKELSNDVQSLADYLSDVTAGGGGDMPEAVQEGMKWAVANNKFTPSARKVMLIFGDAPPHPEDMQKCLEIASDFSAQQEGIVSTVTCRGPNGMPLPEFVEIAQAGGGEAFLTSDEKQIMTQLLVLVFGSKHRGKVLEAFKLLEE
jgi:Mg-chelatase subunit ChlD